MKSDPEKLLRLQAYVDGELPEPLARQVEQNLQSDPDARPIADQLRQVRQTLASIAQEGIELPVTHELYWNRILARISADSYAAPVSGTISVLIRMALRYFTRVALPAAALALLLLAATIAYKQLLLPKRLTTTGKYLAIAWVKDPGTVTYRDLSQGLTLVWLPYPGEN